MTDDSYNVEVELVYQWQKPNIFIIDAEKKLVQIMTSEGRPFSSEKQMEDIWIIFFSRECDYTIERNH